jgi:hypothetical protein
MQRVSEHVANLFAILVVLGIVTGGVAWAVHVLTPAPTAWFIVNDDPGSGRDEEVHMVVAGPYKTQDLCLDELERGVHHGIHLRTYKCGAREADTRIGADSGEAH